MPREKVVAAVVLLLDATLVRVDSRLHFQFTGKSGISHDVSINDPRLARIVRICADLPGQHPFKYRDSDGGIREVGSADVNAYLQAATGGDFTAKDFRTWAGGVHALAMLRTAGADSSEIARKKQVAEAIRVVAQRPRNTVAVCRKCYVHPDVIEAFMHDELLGCARITTISRLRADEARLLKLLTQRAVAQQPDLPRNRTPRWTPQGRLPT